MADAGYANGEQRANGEDQGIPATVPTNRAVNHQGDHDQKSDVRYDAGQDQFICPAGLVLSYQTYSSKKNRRLYARSGCHGCLQQAQCTKADKRWVSRHIDEDARARSQARVETDPSRMNQRGAIVERPFAHLKQIMGMRRFPCWGKTGAKAEMGLAVLAYNLNPMVNELGVQRWLPMISPERGLQKQRTLPGQGSCWPLRAFLHIL